LCAYCIEIEDNLLQIAFWSNVQYANRFPEIPSLPCAGSVFQGVVALAQIRQGFAFLTARAESTMKAFIRFLSSSVALRCLFSPKELKALLKIY
jgi:hypothetical protein